MITSAFADNFHPVKLLMADEKISPSLTNSSVGSLINIFVLDVKLNSPLITLIFVRENTVGNFPRNLNLQALEYGRFVEDI